MLRFICEGEGSRLLLSRLPHLFNVHVHKKDVGGWGGGGGGVVCKIMPRTEVEVHACTCVYVSSAINKILGKIFSTYEYSIYSNITNDLI